MPSPRKLSFWTLCALSASVGIGHADPGQLTVKVDQPGVKISPTFYGLMTEEINHSYDGGLYAELIQNRAFKDDANLPTHWALVQGAAGMGSIALDKTQPTNDALPVSLKLDITAPGARVGVANEGYWGIPVKPKTTYRASFYAKIGNGFSGPLTLGIESNDGSKVYAQAKVATTGTEWRQYSVVLKTSGVAPTTGARYVISGAHTGTVWLNLVSLMPPTLNKRPNGTRPDLMKLMGDMKPSFLRLPGGNYLEGNTIPERFEWKNTIGPLDARAGHQGPWGYHSTDGLGLLEMLEWCEDLHMEPVLAVYAGYSLRGDHITPGQDLFPFVQDALDEIEYVTGDPSTPFGALRAKNGHPKPFPLQYVEIGNEDWFDRSGSYDGRYAQFYDAIKAKYPKLQLIATTGVKSRKPDVVDDHYYRSAAAMQRDTHHYDSTDRSGPKIYVGEWASTEGKPTPTMNAALGDAAWLTGLERNSDVVVMQCYAPLLVNVNSGAAQWGTNLIGYDALHSFGSPSYYVQKMFSNNRGDVVLPVDLVPPTASAVAPFVPKGAIGVGTWNTQAEFKDVKVTNNGTTLFQSDFPNGTTGWKLNGDWKTQDGVLSQNRIDTDLIATAGDPNWTDYSYEVKARKTGGREGFLILFHVEGSDRYVWWNIGGWNNSRSGVQRALGGDANEIGKSSPVTVETGRWYNIRVEVKGSSVNCYLDDKLITTVEDTDAARDVLYATSSRDLGSGDVILKVVNIAASPQQMQIKLQGVSKVKGNASVEVIMGDPLDVNSIANPTKVVPQALKIDNASPNFVHEFPAHSVSVLRIQAK